MVARTPMSFADAIQQIKATGVHIKEIQISYDLESGKSYFTAWHHNHRIFYRAASLEVLVAKVQDQADELSMAREQIDLLEQIITSWPTAATA